MGDSKTTGIEPTTTRLMGEAADPAAARITRALGAISNAGGMDALNASRGEMGVLGYLVAHGGSATPSELGEALGVTSARVANALKALERKGRVAREANPEDGRGVIVRITPAGESFGEANYRAAVERVTGLLEPLSADERAQLTDLVERVARPIVD